MCIKLCPEGVLMGWGTWKSMFYSRTNQDPYRKLGLGLLKKHPLRFLVYRIQFSFITYQT